MKSTCAELNEAREKLEATASALPPKCIDVHCTTLQCRSSRVLYAMPIYF